MTEIEFAEQIKKMGGRAYIVGGWVRDKIMNKKAHDKDYVVCGITKDAFTAQFPKAFIIGNSFPVFSLDISGQKSEVAFARKERKTSQGYTGFEIDFNPEVTIEEDLYRRDTTVNSMAIDILTGELLDYYGGEKDIKNNVLRPVSRHFSEDPVRALRAARQAAQHGFSISHELFDAMRKCRQELLAEPQERLLAELTKALNSRKPSRFFIALQEADLLETVYPELHALIGKTQPKEFHPEGDAFNHTMDIVDKVSAETNNIAARFCGLVHDIGKGTTPADMLPHHYDHENRGLEVLKDWNRRCTLPKEWMKAAEFVIKNHMRAPLIKKPGKITKLIIGIYKLSSIISGKDFCSIINADHKGLPIYLEKYDELLLCLNEVSGKDAPEGLHGPDIGEWIDNARARKCFIWLNNNK